MGKVNPVIWTVERAVNHVLRICKRKTGKDFFADISLAASLRIFEKPHVGSGGHQHASFPTHDAVRHDDVIRKDGAPIGKSIAVGILEQHNAAYRSGVQRIAGVLCHINAPILVPIHCHRTVDRGLGGKGLYAKAFVNGDCPKSVVGTVGRTVRPARPHKESEHHDGNCQHRKRAKQPSMSA